MTKEDIQETVTIVALLFQFALQQPERIEHAKKAKVGDLSGLYNHEERALLWLASQWKRDPTLFISMWTADYVRAVKR